MEVRAVSKPNFQAMDQRELQAYVLAHRDDQDAFYAYVDRLHGEANWVDMPPVQSLDDLANHTAFVQHVRHSSESEDVP
jgi:hypothetical protein